MKSDDEIYVVYAMCVNCRGWNKLETKYKNYGQATKGRRCEFCDSSRFDPQSVRSERTYNPDIAKGYERRTRTKK